MAQMTGHLRFNKYDYLSSWLVCIALAWTPFSFADEASRISTSGTQEFSLLDRLQWRASEYFEQSDLRNAANAIQKGDLATLKSMHKKGLDLKTSGKYGVTLLLWAYLEGNFEAFQLLLDWGADPNAVLMLPEPLLLVEDAEPVRRGESVCFIVASIPNDRKWLDAALKAGGSPLFVSPEFNETVFSVLCSQQGSRGKSEFLTETWLLEHGANINHQNIDGRTPAMSSFAIFDWPRVIYLLERGASVSCYDKKNWQLVHYLAFHRLMQQESDAKSNATGEVGSQDRRQDDFVRLSEILQDKGFSLDDAVADLKRRNESINGIPYMTWRRMQREDKDACTEQPASKAVGPGAKEDGKQVLPKDR